MTDRIADILPTRNEAHGFWCTATLGGLDQHESWMECSRFFMDRYGLCPEDARNLLDSVFGRHLADALVSGMTLDLIATAWRRSIARAIADVKAHREMFQADLAEF